MIAGVERERVRICRGLGRGVHTGWGRCWDRLNLSAVAVVLAACGLVAAPALGAATKPKPRSAKTQSLTASPLLAPVPSVRLLAAVTPGNTGHRSSHGSHGDDRDPERRAEPKRAGRSRLLPVPLPA